MSDMLPLATYSLNVEPYSPTPALNFKIPVTIRITMAAIDPEPFDDDKKPSTLRIIKRNPELTRGQYYNQDNNDGLEEDESESEQEADVPKRSVKSKKGKAVEQSESEDSEDENEIDDEFEECVLLTLSPKGQYQQALDITIAPEEDVQFVVTGSYTISLTGNYVKHPFDNSSDSDEDEEDYYSDEESSNGEEEEEEEEEEDDEELSSGDDDLDDLVDASDIESRLDELVKKDEKKKNNKKDSKRKHEEDEEESAKPAEKKQTTKKDKKAEKVKDSEESKPKPKTKLLEGGIIIEDRVTGKGPHAKKGTRVGMRYVGKLKNGKVFDKNTKGKPFVFKLGQGEVIKGWDIGVAGMAVGGERRIVIPAPYAYGKQALPGIPANSELTFDVKLVSMK
ncbi:AEL_collapsed_G0040230.mRNA.1.CDS.1 [Saccharomyces cerevisiae]|nr:Fpr4p [Saccharomyces cerevisiae YJM1083]AJV59496.1 Fpr4p [Saccharomyces cerevisiae YJM1388]AJV67058.1 Fpr4p [Saccharomyces cerevisiae YJM1460]KAF4000870.1 FK506-binding protein 4 [Saccharomyces cerevisiae]CAI4647541.1 BDF_1d_G0039200.mRNA.1.CDS.1 [Saccharomyces cerevisiae]